MNTPDVQRSIMHFKIISFKVVVGNASFHTKTNNYVTSNNTAFHTKTYN